MVGRDGGKQKPLKQAKKAEKVVLEEDVEFKKKQVCLVSLCLLYLSLVGRREEEAHGRCQGTPEEIECRSYTLM